MSDRVREDPAPFVDDVLVAIGRILSFTSGMIRMDLGNDPKNQDTVIRILEVLIKSREQSPGDLQGSAPGMNRPYLRWVVITKRSESLPREPRKRQGRGIPMCRPDFLLVYNRPRTCSELL